MKKYIINHSQVTSEIFENEAVVVNFMTGKYFGMTGSGPVIWEFCGSPVSHKDITRMFSEYYSEMPDIPVQEIEYFFNALINEKLIVEYDSDKDRYATNPVQPGNNNSRNYEAPKLEIYDDLQELIILDPIHDADPERGWPAQQRMIKP